MPCPHINPQWSAGNLVRRSAHHNFSVHCSSNQSKVFRKTKCDLKCFTFPQKVITFHLHLTNTLHNIMYNEGSFLLLSFFSLDSIFLLASAESKQEKDKGHEWDARRLFNASSAQKNLVKELQRGQVEILLRLAEPIVCWQTVVQSLEMYVFCCCIGYQNVTCVCMYPKFPMRCKMPRVSHP